MPMNLSFVGMSITDILGIDVAIIISPVLHISLSKVYTDNEVVLSMT